MRSCAKLFTGSLKAHFHYVRLNLHEIALHHDYDPAEFKPPYLMRPRPINSRIQSDISPVYIRSLIACVESAHGILDIFLDMTIHTLRSAPVILFTRMFYAIVVLSKLSLSAQSQKSVIGKILDIENIKLVDYLFKIMSILKAAAGSENFSVPFTFYSIVTRLTAWYHRVYKSSRSQEGADEVLNPMKYLRISQDDPRHKSSSGSKSLRQSPGSVQSAQEPTRVHHDQTACQNVVSGTHDYSSNLTGEHTQFSTTHEPIIAGPLMATEPQSTLHLQHNPYQMNFEIFRSFDEFDAYASINQFENSSLLSFIQQDCTELNSTFSQQ
jgi:hypothetical protein